MQYYLLIMYGQIIPSIVNNEEPLDSYEGVLALARDFCEAGVFDIKSDIVCYISYDGKNMEIQNLPSSLFFSFIATDSASDGVQGSCAT